MDSSSCPVKLNSIHSIRSWLARSYYSAEEVRACLNVQLSLYITQRMYETPAGSPEKAYPAVRHYYEECHQAYSARKLEPDIVCANDISV